MNHLTKLTFNTHKGSGFQAGLVFLIAAILAGEYWQ